MKNIAIITGASSGMGRIFAQTLHTHGAYDEVWAIARSAGPLEALGESVKFPVRPIAMDLTRAEELGKLRALLEAEKPRVALLINCSGYGRFDAFEDTSLEDCLGMIDLNCRALTAVTHMALPYMDAGCEVLNIASVAAFQPVPWIGVYGASKAYVLSFSRALARELGRRGIRVFAVCPFWTKTAFFGRAVDDGKPAVVKKFVAMYEPEYIVRYAWRRMKGRGDHCIPGFKAKLQVLAVKVLPHKLVMDVWQKQQKL